MNVRIRQALPALIGVGLLCAAPAVLLALQADPLTAAAS